MATAKEQVLTDTDFQDSEKVLTDADFENNSAIDNTPKSNLLKDSIVSQISPKAMIRRMFPLKAIEEDASLLYSQGREALLNTPQAQGMISGLSDKPIVKIPEVIKDTLDIGDVSARSLGRNVQGQIIDASAYSLMGAGAKVGTLSKEFIEKKPFSSNQEIISEIIKKSESLYKDTAKLLQPSDLAKYLKKDKRHPAVVEISNIIQKEQSPTATKEAIKSKIDDLFTKRKELLVKNNRNYSGDDIVHTKDLAAFIDNLEKTKTATPNQIKGMKEVLENEMDSISYNTFDRLTAEARKEYYQGLAKKVYDKGSDETTDGKTKAYAVLADSLKKMASKGLPEVDRINSHYDGLIKGLDIVSKIEARVLKEPSTFWKRVAYAAGRPSGKSVVAAIVRELPVISKQFDYKAQTGSIAKKANELDALRTIMQNRLKK